MPRRPDVPCGGGCGRLMWRGTGSLAPGKAVCRPCRAEQVVVRRRNPSAKCGYCDAPFESVRRSDGRWTETCSPSCGQKLRIRKQGRPPGRDPEVRRASNRAKNHRRRSAMRGVCDVTAQYERSLRAKAKRCPLCQVKMTDRPYLPHSKELDHIVPLGVGGTHTIGNVRIICRACNVRRPKDGGDYIGPVTLFALEVA